jgi:hypothetical protein
VRRDEAFVAWALAEFLGGPSAVSTSDGPDPPDVYLHIGNSRVGVEVTQLSQFTFEPNGTLGNRSTQDSFGIRLIENLNDSIGPSLPEDISFLIGLWIPVSNPPRFRKLLSAWVTEMAVAPEKGLKQERKLDGSRVSISVVPERPSGKKIVGFVVNTNSSADIGLNARLVLEDRIRRKGMICANLSKPVWLAVLNDYWLADAETYSAAAREIKVAHCFERIFLVSDEGAVSELTVGA